MSMPMIQCTECGKTFTYQDLKDQEPEAGGEYYVVDFYVEGFIKVEPVQCPDCGGMGNWQGAPNG